MDTETYNNVCCQSVIVPGQDYEGKVCVTLTLHNISMMRPRRREQR